MSANQRQTDFLAKVGDMWRSTVARAFAGQASALGAIKAKCPDCCNFDKNEVTNCQTILCPIHEYRPYAKTSVSERRKKPFLGASGPRTRGLTKQRPSVMGR